MNPNPFLGVIFHWIGGLAAASFYLPYKGVRRWSWETYWLVGGIASWIIAPPLFAWLLVPDFWGVITHASPRVLGWTFFFGLTWGIGGLTFGLTMRYLGLALGYAIALGFCAAFGTLIPPLFTGDFGKIVGERWGQITLGGIFVCLVGIFVSGMAGMSKERELSAEQKRASVREFNFLKGLAVAVFCGIMSATIAFAFAAGQPIADVAAERLVSAHALDIWQKLPILVVVLWGGFLSNFVWCVVLSMRNHTGGEYLGRSASEGGSAPRERLPLLRNYMLSALAGVVWYLQFFFYSMGETKMGKFHFSSWTLHMASIIIFGTLWGIALHEWRGTSRRTQCLIATGLFLLVVSTVIVGYGNYVKTIGAT